MPYRVRTLGHIHSQPDHRTLGTYFQDAMLMVFLRGHGTYHLDDSTISVRSGDVMVVPPDGAPGLLASDERIPYDHVQCRFAGEVALATARRIVAERGGKRVFTCERWRELANVLFRGIPMWPGREHVLPGPDRLRPVDAVLAEALALLDNAPPRRPRRLGRQAMLEYMHAHVDQPIDLDQAAAQFGVTKPHLCRTAKRVLGQPLGHAWTALKMDTARALLRDATRDVAEVARCVGYADPQYFSRVFRRATGTSPSIWRRQGEKR